MAGSQKAVRVVRPGEPAASLELANVQVPTPKEGEVLVNVTLRPIDPVDLMGIRTANSAKLPMVAGGEGLGKLAELGPSASKLAKGQRVVAAYPWPQGTWQQYIVVPEADLVPVPDGMSDQDAAQFAVNPVTVVGLFEAAAVPKGEYLLSNAAGSVLGRMLVSYAKSRGVKTINVVRRTSQKQELLDLGADEVISTADEDVVKRVQDITGGKGAYAAADPIGGPSFQDILSAVRPGGTVLVYGSMGGSTARIRIGDVFAGRMMRPFAMPMWLRAKSKDEQTTILRNVLDLMTQGVLKPFAGTSYPLDKFQEAIAESEKPGRGGKVFLEG